MHGENGHVHARTHLQRQRRVKCPAGSRGATRNKERAGQQNAPTGSSQKLKLFIRAKAISEAPICNGII